MSKEGVGGATYEVEDVWKLLNACEKGDESNPPFHRVLTARNKAIVVLFIATGIRLSELVGLRLGDLDRQSRVILVHRKGNKWQLVPVSRDGFKPLHSYLSNHLAVLASSKGDDYRSRKDDAVFLANDGEPLTIWDVSMLFKRLKKRTGIDGKRVSAHQCRRYMATTQLAMDRSPLDVQRQMRHTTLTMTSHYASHTTQQLQKSHKRYSPLRAEQGSSEEAFGKGYWKE